MTINNIYCNIHKIKHKGMPMINIDLANNVFKVTIPTNEKEFEYLQSESLIAIGAFLAAKEKKEQRVLSDKEILKLVNYGRLFANMTKFINANKEKNK